MNLSVGVLYDCQAFLDLCSGGSFNLLEVRNAFDQRYKAAPIGSILDMMRAANWITFGNDGSLDVTERGSEIIACKTAAHALRFQILDYIAFIRPAWGSLIPRGRAETLPFLPPDARQCFSESGLSEGYDPETVAFWDQAANLSRGRTDDARLSIGRTGERLSIEYEEQRTGRRPTWKAIDSNLAGYDLLSVISRDDSRPLRVEVKATQKADGKSFYMSSGEWKCALTFGTYVLHFWILGPVPTLIIKTADEIAPNIPDNHGDGVWQTVNISLRAHYFEGC